ncbi:MAG: Nramp family divalent metal transporter [Acidobacteria bacterium]|nr:Nramp family divalent metal transporter [Acidobacteriota bacterium]
MNSHPDPQPEPQSETAPAPPPAGKLPAWETDELPAPPTVNFRNILRMIGPGAILLATSIGGGEWLVGPAAVVQYGPAILGVVTVSIIFQVFFNLEAIRYTLYTGEPIYGGFLRLWPGPKLWAPVYVLISFMQLAWPAMAAAAAASIIAALYHRLPEEGDASLMHGIGIGLVLLVVLLLTFGGTIEKMLERISFVMLGMVLTFLLVVNIFFIPWSVWIETLKGFGQFSGFQENMNWPLIGALASTAAAGGLGNLTVTNWMRDKNFGMGAKTGAIPSAVGGQRVEVSHFGKIFTVNTESLVRWRNWWRFVHIDQVWFWGGGAFLGMFLNVNLASGVVPRGTVMEGMAVGVYQAQYLAEVAWTGFWTLTLINGFWILFSTQLGNTDILIRTVTDVVWMGSRRLREWREGKIQKVYYGLLLVYTFLAFFAIRVGNPLTQFKIIANVAGLIMVIGGIQIFLVNRKFLPRALQGAWWKQAGLLACVVFYALIFARVIFSLV